MKFRTLRHLPLALMCSIGCASSGPTTSDDGSTGTGGSWSSAAGGMNASGGAPTSGGASSGGRASGGSESGGAGAGGAPASGGSLGDGSGGASTASSASGGAASGSDGSGGEGSGAQDTFNPCPQNGSVCKILPFGDSITWGTGSTDDGGYRSKLFALTVQNNKNITFVGSLSAGPDQVLGVAFPKTNEGRFGWTIDPGYSSWAGGVSTLVPSPAFDTIPHIVLLMIGTNDVNADHGQSTMTDRLESLLDAIVEAAPDALIVLAQITPLGFNAPALGEYNSQIPGIADARAEMGQHFIHVDMSKMPSSGISGDSIHPNDSGYQFMAQTWYDAIVQYLPD